jgi:integrase
MRDESDASENQFVGYNPKRFPALALFSASRGAGTAARLLQLAHPQHQHPPRLPRGGPAVLRLLCGPRHRGSRPAGAGACGGVCRGAAQAALKAHGEAAAGRAAHALRLDGGRPDPAVNPAHAVRGPKHSQRRGKTPVLQADEARALLDAIDTTSLPGLRDRGLIGLMVYTFARVGAAVAMKVEDYFVQGRRGWVRLHEKGGKEHEMPTHHNLDRYLEEYISAAGIVQDRKGPLFRTTRCRSGELTSNSLLQSDVWRMIRRRALAAGIKTEIGCHTFRATGITAYLKNGGKREIAQQMAAHESARTTGLYDRRSDGLTR